MLLLFSACAAPPLTVVTQNAGTTRFLDVEVSSPLRPLCEEGYSNNLCTVPTEEAVGAALEAAAPHVVFLEEMWHQPLCDEDGRDPAWGEPPLACSSSGSQLDRVVPEGMSFACSPTYPDNCVAWDPRRFVPDTPCDGRDCGLGLTDLEPDCGSAGRIAIVDGTLDRRPTTLMVVHLNAGPFADDATCRATQLASVSAGIRDREPRHWLIGGDWNFDPGVGEGEDAVRFREVLDDWDLTRLDDDGDTARLLGLDLDAIVVGGLATEKPCHVSVADADLSPPMLDHGMLVCEGLDWR